MWWQGGRQRPADGLWRAINYFLRATRGRNVCNVEVCPNWLTSHRSLEIGTKSGNWNEVWPTWLNAGILPESYTSRRTVGNSYMLRILLQMPDSSRFETPDNRTHAAESADRRALLVRKPEGRAERPARRRRRVSAGEPETREPPPPPLLPPVIRLLFFFTTKRAHDLFKLRSRASSYTLSNSRRSSPSPKRQIA